MNEHDKTLARQVIALLDLTSLNDDDTDAHIEQLCRKALTPLGPVAAVCVYPRFVALARRTLNALGGAQVQVATVCNFPGGDLPLAQVLEQVAQALANGADEIDVVYPYKALQAGDSAQGPALVAACKALCANKRLKVILETGQLPDELIRRASADAIDAGADFIKTSTGKVQLNATPHAAQIMLEAIADSGRDVGLKPAGGMRELREATPYLWLAERVLGEGWISPAHLRLGASSLLDNILRQAGESAAPAAHGGY